jgi:hypothetical protein
MTSSAPQPAAKDQSTTQLQFRLVPRPPWDEETPNKYDDGAFHPVRVGDIYNDNYKVIRKLGVGAYSTVWLANDIRYKVDGLVSTLMFQEGSRGCVESSQTGRRPL